MPVRFGDWLLPGWYRFSLVLKPQMKKTLEIWMKEATKGSSSSKSARWTWPGRSPAFLSSSSFTILAWLKSKACSSTVAIYIIPKKEKSSSPGWVEDWGWNNIEKSVSSTRMATLWGQRLPYGSSLSRKAKSGIWQIMDSHSLKKNLKR